MFFFKKKIGKITKLLDSKKRPAEFDAVVHAIEMTSPEQPRAQFQKALRDQLLLKHQIMAKSAPNAAMQQEPAPQDKRADEKEINSSKPFRFRGLAFAGAFVILLVIAGLIGYPLVPAPTVEGYTLRENVRKISYNAPIKVVFTQPMDKASVEGAFHIEPLVKGKFEWNNNTLMFYPESNFEIGKTYAVTVEKKAKSFLQKSLTTDYEEMFNIVAAPKVALFSPAPNSEAVTPNAKITVLFDRPMIALTTLDQGVAKAPDIRISPDVKGKFKWLGTSSVQFIPEKLKNATKYTVTVPKGTAAADGGVTEEDYTLNFTTLKPELLSTYPEDKNAYNGPKTKIKLEFNQAMKLDATENSIGLYLCEECKDIKDLAALSNLTNADMISQFDQAIKAGNNKWKKINFKARYLTLNDLEDDKKDVVQDQPWVEIDNTPKPTVDELNKTIVLEPEKELPYQSAVAVRIYKGFAGAEGEFPLADDKMTLFETVGALKVISSDPANDSSGSNLYGINITFSQPIDLDSFRDKVVIKPTSVDKDTKKKIEPILNLDWEGAVLNIGYSLKPSTDYTVTIKAGGKDRYGQTLAKDFVLKFKTQAIQPEFELLNRSDISVLDANKAPVYYVKSTNVSNIHFDFKKLTEEEFDRLYYYGYINDQAQKELAGSFVSWDKKIDKKFNEEVYTQINLSKESGSTLEPGIYSLSAWSNEVIDEYRHEPRVYRQVIVYTNTALAMKKSSSEVLVWATSLKDGAPVKDMEITLKSSRMPENADQTATVLSAKTDKQGLATIKLPAQTNTDYYNNDYTIWGKNGSEIAIVHSTWSDGVAPWNFNIDYDPYPSQYYAYIYTDRPIYRPGHDVYFKGLLRRDADAVFRLPDIKKVHVLINDSQGEKVYEKDLTLNANGTFNDQLKLGDKARTGNYVINMTLADVEGPSYMNNYSGSFYVAEYRKPDYELKVSADKENYVNGDKAKIKVKASYFFGAPMPNAQINYTVRSQDYYFFLNTSSNSPYANQWFSFSEDAYSCWWGCQGTNEIVATGKAKLDANGEFTIELPLDIKERKVSQLYTVEVTAFDLNNQTVSNRVSMPVHKGEFYAGILNNDYMVEKGKPVKFEVISVDFNGDAVSGKKMDVTLYKRDWNTIKKKNVDGGFYYENGYEDTKIETKSVTTDGKGHATISFQPKDGGMFKATVESKDGRGNLITASTTVYVSSDTFINWGRENNDRIELVPDKLEYKPGDTAHILIKSPYQNVRALITQERQGILSKEVKLIKSNSDTIDVPITEKSIPNLFVSVLLVKGSGDTAGLAEPAAGAQDERNVAAFKMGYATLQVNTSSKKLNVEVKSDREKYHPGDEVTLRVKTTDNSGKAVSAEVSISVVDKSVLSLTDNVTADLLNAFYRKRLLGVTTAETLTKALSRVNVQVEAGLKGGGGGALQKRGTFKDTAYWQSNVQSGNDGEATVKFKLPDNLTTWQTLAIGITKDTLVGSQKSEFLVSKDVLVRPVLPRFLIQKDVFSAGAIIHNYTDKALQLDVSMEASGVKLNDAATQQISLDSGAEKKVEWPIEVLNEKEATLTFKVVAKDNASIGDILEQKLPIEAYSFPEVVATSSVITDNAKHVETVWLPSDIDLNFGELTIQTAPTLAGSIKQGIEYLVTFPYGCVEQTTSSLLPNLVVKQIINLPGLKTTIDEKKLQKNVEAGLQALYKFQQPNGGWGIWDTSETTPYLTSYVLFTLNEAQKAGYKVDEKVMDNGKNFLKSYMKEHPLAGQKEDTKYKDSMKPYLRYEANARAYALYVLAELGAGDLALSNNLYDIRENLNLFGKAYLAMDYALLRKSAEAAKDDLNTKVNKLKDEILNKAKESPRGMHFEEDTNEYRLFDTNTRTTAIVMQMLVRIDPQHPYIQKILHFLLMEKKDGRYVSTQETAVTLLALIEYLKSSKELEPSFNGIVTLNGTEILNKTYTQKNLEDRDIVTKSLKDMLPDNQDNEITVTKNGAGKLYFDMNLKYYLPTEKIEPRDEGIVVTHDYYADTDQKMENPLTSVKVGQNIKAKVTVMVPEDRYYVMVEDYLPAGLEGIDFNLSTAQQELQNQLYNNGGKGAVSGKGGYFGGGYDLSYDYSNYGPWTFNYSEVRDDRVMYFADYLPKGVYEIEYFVRATTPGVYHDLPVLAQELYFPEVFGRSEGKIFTVTE